MRVPKWWCGPLCLLLFSLSVIVLWWYPSQAGREGFREMPHPKLDLSSTDQFGIRSLTQSGCVEDPRIDTWSRSVLDSGTRWGNSCYYGMEYFLIRYYVKKIRSCISWAGELQRTSARLTVSCEGPRRHGGPVSCQCRSSTAGNRLRARVTAEVGS